MEMKKYYWLEDKESLDAGACVITGEAFWGKRCVVAGELGWTPNQLNACNEFPHDLYCHEKHVSYLSATGEIAVLGSYKCHGNEDRSEDVGHELEECGFKLIPRHYFFLSPKERKALEENVN